MNSDSSIIMTNKIEKIRREVEDKAIWSVLRFKKGLKRQNEQKQKSASIKMMAKEPPLVRIESIFIPHFL